jgi:small subunit ribosomal protein S29
LPILYVQSKYFKHRFKSSLFFLLLLQDFLKYNETGLQQLPCQIFEPIPLGEGADVGMMKGADAVEMPKGSTLYDLIQTGITNTHASVGALVLLRSELSLVKRCACVVCY